MRDRDREEKALQVASFRYRIIADAAEAGDQGVRAAIAAAARREYVDPAGNTVGFSTRTLWRWLGRYQRGGLVALQPQQRQDTGQLRAVSAQVLERAVALRAENEQRATKTIIDILEREKTVTAGDLKRSTLDRHLDRLGASRRRLHTLGKKTFKKILTTAPMELVVADFHHGPYVRIPGQEDARRALLLAFIDHFSRYILEARYYLHEDFAALRFGFRRLLLVYGLITLLYIDNGPSFHSNRFHAACSNEAIGTKIVHSKEYTSEGRGVAERFNRTIKEQFESEARGREELLTLDELNAYLEAWLSERYHRDIHSETTEAPFERFHAHAVPRAAPELDRIDELLRLRKSARVHKKWSIVEVRTTRYVVDPALRGRRVHVLYDVFDPAYVLIEFDGRIIERAYPQQAGQAPPELKPAEKSKSPTDYLTLLRRDYEARTQAELATLNLRPPAATGRELPLTELEALISSCRATQLSAAERSAVSAGFRKLRPIDPETARRALQGAQRRLGAGLHVRLYLEALETSLVKQRTKGAKSS